MKIFKLINFILCLALSFFLIVSACLPGNKSSAQSGFVSKIVGNTINGLIKEKRTYAKSIETKEIKEGNIGSSINIEAYVLPKNASYKNLTYSVNNDNIYVDCYGQITFLKEGTSIITIEQNDSNINKTLALEIKKVLPTDLIIYGSTKIKTNEAKEINVLITPSNTTNKDIVFRSSDEQIASVDNGVVYGKKKGFVTIFAKLGNIEKSLPVEILEAEEVLLTNIEVVEIDNIMMGTTKEIETFFTPLNATNTFLYYETSNKDIATIEKGFIKPHKPGIVTITVSNYTKTINKEITINIINEVPKLDISNQSIPVGSSKKFDFGLNNYTAPYVTYISSDTSIAVINNDGTITTKALGKTTITINYDDSINSKSTTFELNVIKQTIYEKVNNFDYLIRKLIGHFGAFLVLGILSFICFFGYIKDKKKQVIICLLYGLFMAFLTELIQLGTANRAGQFKDVMIDYSGYLMAFILAFIIYFKSWKKEK